MTSTIIVCDTCKYNAEERHFNGKTGGEILHDHITAAASGNAHVTICKQSCLMGCKRRCNVAVVANGKIQYVLGEFTPDIKSAKAIVEYATLHAQSDNGQVPLRDWPEDIKGHFQARIVPLNKG